MEPGDLESAPTGDWQRGRLTSDGYSAAVDPQHINTLIIRRATNGGTPVETARIARHNSYDGISCYAFLPGRRQVVVGSNYGLTLHDADSGTTLREFVGHTGIIWAVAVSPDGRTLLSASGDQTLKLWDLESVVSDPQLKTVAPLLNFFFTKDQQDFVAWTEEGYYSASPGGEDLIGWHTNRGIDKAASFPPRGSTPKCCTSRKWWNWCRQLAAPKKLCSRPPKF
ncbi:MAG: hypothetical protein R3C49_21460 [Planctomycetaceae bacterium]